MVGRETVIVAGIGLGLGCTGEEIAALVRRACAQAARDPALLAAPSFRRAEAGLRDAADALGLDLVLVPDAALAAAQPGCVTRSARAMTQVGFASVAEACALAASGAGGRLILPRIAAARVTCALAAAG